MHGTRTSRLLLLMLLGTMIAWGQEEGAAPAAPKPNRFEDWIARFEKQDAENPPPRGEVLFLGSSSIVGWKLEHWFPELVALNRGFGGSRIDDSVYFFDRVVVPYAPKTIVFYAGDNDIVRMTPEAVAADFTRFTDRLSEALPECRLIYLSIKPSGRRAARREEIRQANALIAEQCEQDERWQYVEVGTLLLDEEGAPRPELYKADQLHLSAAGYAIWSAALAPLLETKAATE